MKDEKEQWLKIWRKNVPCRPTNQSKNMEVKKTCASVFEEQRGGWCDGSRRKEEMRSER